MSSGLENVLISEDCALLIDEIYLKKEFKVTVEGLLGQIKKDLCTQAFLFSLLFH